MYNSPKYDKQAAYDKKSIADLQDELRQFETAYAKHPTMARFNEHLQYIRGQIAERIGKKNR